MRRVIVVVLVGLLIAIAKPWGNGIGPSSASAPQPSLGPAATPKPSASTLSGTYDFLAFGTNEPPPGWELWPAGSLASYSYAMRIDMAVSAVPTSEPAGSVGPGSPPPTPAPTPVGAPSAAGVPASWPTIRVPRGSILDLVGINQPLGYSVHVTGLTRIEDDGSVTRLRALLATSPWPDHFTTVGYAPRATEDAMAPWPRGRYRLELTIDPGGVRRTLEIVVEGPADTAPSRSPSDSPGDSAAP